MSKWKELDEKLNSFLRLSTFPIGLKLLKDNYKEELKTSKRWHDTVKELSPKLYGQMKAYCDFVAYVGPTDSIKINWDEVKY